MASAKKKGLGRGLDALLGADPAQRIEAEPAAAPDAARLLELDPRAITPNPMQPRSVFSEDSLQELAESIRRDGIQEPVIVRKTATGYELVSGERRVRAAVMADLSVVPAICRAVSDADMLKLGLIENIHREDLNPIELALAYQRLMDEFAWTQERVATEVGKNRATVANTLRLLQLPPDLHQAIANGAITMGHAKALLALPTVKAQRNAARKIIANGMSVRQAEKLAAPPQPKTAQTTRKDPNTAQLEDQLRRKLGTRVTLKASKSGRGRIEIEYFNLDELERILEILRRS